MLKHACYCIQQLTLKDIKVRYKNNFLGYFWSLANPLSFALIYYFAFKIILNIQIENYALFLISGLFPWQWMTLSITGGTRAFLHNAGLLKKVQFPLSSLVISNILMELFHYSASLVILFLAILYFHSPLYWEWIYHIPFLIVLQFIWCLGMGLLCGTINVFFRDLERLVDIGFRLLFYASAILYSAERIPEKYKWTLDWNPFACFIMAWRSVFFDGTLDPVLAMRLIGFSVVFLVFGFFIFNRFKYKFSEVV